MKITESERNRILSKYGNKTNYDLIFEQVYITSTKVKEIQNELNKIFNAGLDPDGKLGPMTLAAIKKHLNITVAPTPETPIEGGQSPSVPAKLNTLKPMKPKPFKGDLTAGIKGNVGQVTPQQPTPAQLAPATGQPQASPSQQPASATPESTTGGAIETTQLRFRTRG